MKKHSNTQILTEAHHDFSRALSRFAHSKISDQTLSDDLVQATFMKTWIYLQKKGKVHQMRGFLYHVLNGLIIDEYRKTKALSLDILSEEKLELKVVQDERIFNHIDAQALLLLIEKLPEKYKNVINMRYIKEFSIKEMSVITKSSQNAVSVQVHRGLAKLRILSSAGNIL